MEIKLKVKILNKAIGDTIPFPGYATDGAAGFDLYACIDEPITIEPGKTAFIGTGIAIQIPSRDIAALLYARSGLGCKKGIVPSNCVGVIDSDYRGEVTVALYNHNNEPFVVRPGDRIVQMVITPIIRAKLEACDELDETVRGTGGFGSTGLA